MLVVYKNRHTVTLSMDTHVFIQYLKETSGTNSNQTIFIIFETGYSGVSKDRLTF